MSTDGVNPFGNQSSTHSTCRVVLSIYNLPPWLCKKQKYMMLRILVSGSKQPGDLIDVYLRQLVDDLKTLWKPGVKEDWDEFQRELFTSHGMLFTTINDNPAHCNLSGQNLVHMFPMVGLHMFYPMLIIFDACEHKYLGKHTYV